jgi:hypothetical protein
MLPDLRGAVSITDRERPLVTGANGTLMARTRGWGLPRAGAGKILPRPHRTVGVKKRRPEPYTRGAGRQPRVRESSPGPHRPGARRLRYLARTRHSSPGVHLSPSATLRVAGTRLLPNLTADRFRLP